MTGAEGIGSGAAAFFASRATLTQSLGAARGHTGGEGAGGLTGGEGAGHRDADSASISGVGQLLSALQQLRSQSPTKFTQTVSQIASQLQDAAQQQGQTGQGKALSNLAAQFQSAATSGDLSAIQLSHHQHAASSPTYQSNGQQTNSVGNDKSSWQQIFSSIANEVNAAIGS